MNLNQQKDPVNELVKHINLRIDPSVQKLCETYNSSSGATRSVLYFMLIGAILSTIAGLNTIWYSWTDARLSRQNHQIESIEKQSIMLENSRTDSLVKLNEEYTDDKRKLADKKAVDINSLNQLKYKYRDKVKYQKKKMSDFLAETKSNNLKLSDIFQRHYTDSIKLETRFKIRRDSIMDKIKMKQVERDNLLRNRIENFQTVKVIFIGDSFDVNNLALLSALSFTCLLMVARYTLSREKSNLRIALQAVTDRYHADLTIDNLFDDDLIKDIRAIKKADGFDENDLFKKINKRRRRYHYNFLSMNEVFNMPKLDITDNKSPLSNIISKNIFWFPFAIYLMIYVNDLLTIEKGWQLSPTLTVVSVVLSFFGLNTIHYFCNECTTQKRKINAEFDRFYGDEQDPQYIYVEHIMPSKPYRLINEIFVKILLGSFYLGIKSFLNNKLKKKEPAF